jgi:hypothetical protein
VQISGNKGGHSVFSITNFIVFLFFLALFSVILTGCGKVKITVSPPTVSPAVAGTGDTVSISVDVLNPGKKPVTAYELVFSVNSVITDTKLVNLNPAETTSFSFSYVPETTGYYKITVNEQAGSFTAVKPASIKVAEINSSSDTIILGEEVLITADILNEGDLPGSYQAVFSVNEIDLKTEDLVVEGGQTLSPSTSYTPDKSGTYIFQVGDLTKSIDVLNPAAFESSSIIANPSSVLVGEITNISAKITNSGDVSGVIKVPLLVNDVEISSKDVSLGGGESATVEFPYSTETSGVLRMSIMESNTTLVVKSLKVYENTDYYYTISYPPDYRISKVDAVTTSIEQSGIGGITILVDPVPVNEIAMSYFEIISASKQQQLPDWNYSNRTVITENGFIVGYKYDYTNTIDGVKWVGKGMVMKKGGLGFYVVYTTKEVYWDKHKNIAPLVLDSFVLPPISTGRYTNTDLGITIELADDWTALETTDPSTPVKIFSFASTIIGGIGTEDASGVTAQTYVESFVSIFTLSGWTLNSKGPITFDNANTGYEATVSSDLTGNAIKTRLVAVKSGDKMYFVLFAGFSTSLDPQNDVITVMVKTMVVGNSVTSNLSKSEFIYFPEKGFSALFPAPDQRRALQKSP